VLHGRLEPVSFGDGEMFRKIGADRGENCGNEGDVEANKDLSVQKGIIIMSISLRTGPLHKILCALRGKRQRLLFLSPSPQRFEPFCTRRGRESDI
jgi:hypothetical protein